MGGEEQEVVGQGEQALGQRAIQRPRHLLHRLLAVGMQIGTPGIADQERVARQDHPGLLPAPMVGDEVGMVGARVAGGGNGLNQGVAELDALAVDKLAVLELNPGALRQVSGRTSAVNQLWQPRDVVGLEVRFQDGGDPAALAFSGREVFIDQVRMRIDHGQLAGAVATEEVRGAGGLVVQKLAEEHIGPPGRQRLGDYSNLLNTRMTPDRTSKKGVLFEAIAVMGKALASPRRLELLELLAQAPRTVVDLADASAQPVASTSQHLQALHAAGLVDREREGNHVRYAIAGDRALGVWLTLRDASAAQLGEVERAARSYLGDEVEQVGRNELLDRLRRGDVVLVDVRPTEEFAAGHIEGARSIPTDELERRLDELPADLEVIAYCRGPFCAYAHDAVRTLRAHGREARRLEEGWPEWRLAEQEPGSVVA